MKTISPGVELERISSGAGDKFVLNMGPQHPSTHGVLRLILELDGERVTRCEPVIGYLHTGIEKQCEYRTYHQVIPLIDRMDYLAGPNEELGYVLAVEKLLGIEAPRRTRYIRVLIAELSRIASHLVWLGTGALELNVSSVFMYCFRDREYINDLFEAASGARMFPRYFRVGGLIDDLPEGFTEQARGFIKSFRPHLKEYHGLLTRNPIWMKRTVGVARVSRRQCMDYALTGPILRATGLEYDIRRAFPYSVYPDFDFDIPTQTAGDAYARYLVRMAEMAQSLKIVEQALDKLPEGPVNTVSRDLSDRNTYRSHPWRHFVVPPGEVYQSIESPRGEKGYYVVSDGTNKPVRMRMRSPSFINVQALPLLIEGSWLADAVVAIASVDPVLGDVDR
ncbi:MAG TPA: NADH-quinone oxidoreductase subunit D [Candidatus Fraserbacteria bacterium]|nr:NADH-quinone oxidoreductase subunit D [Candidatus Fraserbacteria bacterium]